MARAGRRRARQRRAPGPRDGIDDPRRALACLYGLVCRTDARGTAVIVAAACAVGRGCGRATRAAGTCLADVRPHPPQGSRAVHTVGRGDAERNAFPRGLAGSAVAADLRQPLRTGHDLATSDEAWGRGDRQAWRDHARVRYQQRETHAPWRSARPRRGSCAHRYCGAPRGFTARRANRTRRGRPASGGRQRIRPTRLRTSADK